MGRGLSRTKLWAKGGSSSSGGGGGGDMFKATYDPANLASQVLVTPISITVEDFVDLVSKTNTYGNNPSFSGLSYGQTYAISGMNTFGYNADCIYYIGTVKNDNNDVVPETLGFITAPYSASSNVYQVYSRWNPGSESVYACVLDSNFFYYIPTAASLDKTQISGETIVGLSGCKFYGTWSVDLTGVTNLGSNINISGCNFYENTNISVNDDELVQIATCDISNSSIYFTPKNSGVTQNISGSVIRNANITFSDNTGGSSNQGLENCIVDGIDLIIGIDAVLDGCRFIGQNNGYSIIIPDGYIASGKTFVQGDYSTFEHTIDLNDFMSGGALSLPNSYKDFIGIYNTTNPIATSFNITTIDVGTSATHKFKIYGNADKGTDFIPSGTGGSVSAGQFFVTSVMAISGNFSLAGYHDYLEFQKANIGGEPDALRITDYGILS